MRLKETSVRTSLPILAAVGTVLLLAGCTAGSDSATPTSTPNAKTAGCVTTAAGAQSKSVSVSGDFLATPTVKISTPLKAKSFQRSIAIKGTGAKALPDRTADIALAAYNGTTGKSVLTQGFDGSTRMPVAVDDTQLIPGLVRAIECVPAGSRVVLTAPAAKAFGNGDPTQLGLKKTDSIVFVADIEKVVPNKATGTPQKDAMKGMPTVTLADDGTPSVTVPKTDPPKKTTVEVLKKGDGATVKKGDLATIQYQGVNWRTGKVFDQSWGSSAVSYPTTTYVKGFQKALVGQKVGSQVLVTIPPADGYGSKGNTSVGIKGTDTLVFVIDILQTLNNG